MHNNTNLIGKFLYITVASPPLCFFLMPVYFDPIFQSHSHFIYPLLFISAQLKVFSIHFTYLNLNKAN